MPKDDIDKFDVYSIVPKNTVAIEQPYGVPTGEFRETVWHGTAEEAYEAESWGQSVDDRFVKIESESIESETN